jgi:hypothetical protein
LGDNRFGEALRDKASVGLLRNLEDQVLHVSSKYSGNPPPATFRWPPTPVTRLCSSPPAPTGFLLLTTEY